MKCKKKFKTHFTAGEYQSQALATRLIFDNKDKANFPFLESSYPNQPGNIDRPPTCLCTTLEMILGPSSIMDVGATSAL